jgi:hypothetical protein
MDDLRDRFATLDRVPVPDLWSDVERRLESLDTTAPTGDLVAVKHEWQGAANVERSRGSATPVHGRRDVAARVAAAMPVLALAAVLIVAVVGLRLASGSGPGGPRAIPSPSPAPSAGPSAFPSAIACWVGGSPCAGILSSGEHQSKTFAPSLTFQVPDGWENGDSPDSYLLSSRDGTWSPPPIFVRSHVAIADQTASCDLTRKKSGVGGSVQQIIGYLRTHPGLIATNPFPVEVGGFKGQSIDLLVAQGWTQTCPVNPDNSVGDGPTVMLFTDAGTPNPWNIGLNGTDRMRLIALDVAGETIVIETIWPSTSSLAPVWQRIIDSFRFAPVS